MSLKIFPQFLILMSSIWLIAQGDFVVKQVQMDYKSNPDYCNVEIDPPTENGLAGAAKIVLFKDLRNIFVSFIFEFKNAVIFLII
jgi:hypothetical protein